MGLHPKVLLIDVGKEAADALTARQINAQVGAYGVPYEQTARSENLRLNYDLPNFAEQEILAIDLTLRQNPWTKEQIAAHGYTDARTVHAGRIDPVPGAMSLWRPEANRILRNGGAFVIFAAPPRSAHYFLSGHNAPEETWGFISWHIAKLENRDHIEITADAGKEITVVDNGPFGRLLRRHLQSAYFTCTIGFRSYIKSYEVVAVSKYRAPIAVLIKGDPKGVVFIVPQIRDKGAFLIDLISGVLPEVCPHLYESVKAAKWVRQSAYELEPVSDLQVRVTEIRQAADEQVEAK